MRLNGVGGDALNIRIIGSTNLGMHFCQPLYIKVNWMVHSTGIENYKQVSTKCWTKSIYQIIIVYE